MSSTKDSPAALAGQDSPVLCPSCPAEIVDHYCPVCGQRRTRRITFGRVFEEGAEHVLSLDSAFLRTIFGLAKRPSQICRDYLDGRRKPFMNPIKYVFVLATVFAVVINKLGILPPTLPADNPDAVRLYRFIVSAVGYLAYLYMLPVALVQSWLFRQPRYGVAECYVTLLFFYGQFLIFATLLAATGIYSSTYGLVILRLGGLLYFLWLLTGLYRGATGWKLVKGILLYLFYSMVNIGSAILIGLAMGMRPPS